MSIELQATSIADRAYVRIRTDIVFGCLGPGTRLRLDRLAVAYGASVSTLREILSRLSSEGMVLAEGQLGFSGRSSIARWFRGCRSHAPCCSRRYALPLSFTDGDLEWESRVVARITSCPLWNGG